MLTWRQVVRLLGPKLRRALMSRGSPDGPAPPVAEADRTGREEPGDWTFSREELRAINEEIAQDLPVSVPAETLLALVDIDPSHVHVYWQVQRADMEAARRSAGVRNGAGESMVLKVHDALCMTMTGFIPWPELEFEVEGLNGSRHVEVPDAGHTLIAELGLRAANGGFVPLTWSKPVRLPRPGEAEVRESVDLVVIDEPGNPPRVLEVQSVPSTEQAPAEGQPPASSSDAGSLSVLKEWVSSRDLHHGVWSSGLPPGSWDEARD